MQLPRGTFREIIKGVELMSLLHALDREKFSGIANLSSPSLAGTLVFKAGKCILVKVGNSRGDTGWGDVQNAGTEEVDAALSVLGDAQIGLALEFNKPCRILKSGKLDPAPISNQPANPATRETPHTSQPQKTAAAVAPSNPSTKPEPTFHQVPAPAPPPRAPPPQGPPLNPYLFSKTVAAPVHPSPPLRDSPPRSEEKDSTEKDHDTGPFEDDLDTFESMDIENVTDKIRTDCKTIIKQLHLDHLMER